MFAFFCELETRVEIRTGSTPSVFSHLPWPPPTDLLPTTTRSHLPIWGVSRQVAAAHPAAEI